MRSGTTRPECAGRQGCGWTGFALMAGSVAGAALQLQQAALWHGSIYAALLVLAAGGGCLLVWRRASGCGWRMIALALLSGALAGAGLAGSRAVAHASDALDPALDGRDLIVEGRVAQMPQRHAGGVRFAFELESARWLVAQPGDATRVQPAPRVPPRIHLSWYAQDAGAWASSAPVAGPAAPAFESPHAGERWRLAVRLKAPHGTLNPHGFDLELRAWEQGEHATGHVRTGALEHAPLRIAATWRHPVERAREAVRDAILERVEDRRAAGVVAALVTGDQQAIERADWEVFRATGVAHLMSISGLHVTLFAWLAAWGVGAVWRRSARLVLWLPAPRAALVGGVLLAALYAVFSGWGVPSRRTVWMLATVALLRLGGRQWPWPCVWLTVCAVVVGFDPLSLLTPGFWLSFVAVGVLFASGAGVDGSGRAGVATRLGRMLREQWTVTLALTPLTLLLFQQVSLIGLAANALAIPWVTLVVTPLALLGVAVAPLWTLAAWATQALILLLGWFSHVPFATLSMPAPPLWMAVAGLGGGLLMVMRLPVSMRLLGLPLFLPLLMWQSPRPVPGEFELLAADVGQGNAVLVRTAHRSLLYDTGPRYGRDSDAGQRVLVPLLRALGERLDTLVLSHRDSDHTGGAAAVLAMQPGVVVRGSIEAAHPLQALAPVRPCVAGERWTWDGVDFAILHPAEADPEGFTRPNALSCVLRVTNGRAAALLTGDIEQVQESALAARAPDLRADLLLVPHHGSRTSSSAALLDAVRPRIALIQAGWRNRFGHPASEVLARLYERGIAVFDSPRCGAAFWSSEAPGELRCHRQEARRYWHHVEDQGL